MRSSADFWGKWIEADRLFVYAQCYSLGQNECYSLNKDIYSFINGLFSENCVLKWTGGVDRIHRIRTEEDILNKAGEHIWVSGNVKSERVYNLKTFNRYIKDIPETGRGTPYRSANYYDYLDREIIPDCYSSREKYIQSLLKLLTEERVKNINLYYGFDVQAGTSVSNPENDGLYNYKIYFRMPCICLGDEINTVAEKFAAWGRMLSEKYRNINYTILIVPTQMSMVYGHYFGRFPELLYQKMEDPNYDMMYYCMEGVYIHEYGWYNILSPATVSLLCGAIPYGNNGRLSCERLSNGGLEIRINDNISNVTLNDLGLIKTAIYPALCPGYQYYNIDLKKDYLRSNWEKISIGEDEIEILNGKIKIKHKDEFDEYRLMQLYDLARSIKKQSRI